MLICFVVFFGALDFSLCESFQENKLGKQYHVSKGIDCNISKIYHRSSFERKWFENIDRITDNTGSWKKGCDFLLEDKDKVEKLMTYWSTREHFEDWKKIRDWRHENILSYFEMREDCGHGLQVTHVPIEPLISFLRHPKFLCFPGIDVVDKNYMYLTWRDEVIPSVKRQNLNYGSRSYYFDLGASTYSTGAGGASQSWFVEEYLKRGIDFDRILAWEVSPIDPNNLFNSYPAHVVGKVSYFNVPANIDSTHGMNPIRMLKQIVRPDDFLMLKIDIDNDPVEWVFIESILNDQSVADLIDEMFFEHHVNLNPTEHNGWGTSPKLMNITQSYGVFTKLRSMGIRAHSWV
jgi:hypothetical protein